jgi:hypothetical protein
MKLALFLGFTSCLLQSTLAQALPKLSAFPKVGEVCEIRPGVLGTKEFCAKQNVQPSPTPPMVYPNVCPIAIVIPKTNSLALPPSTNQTNIAQIVPSTSMGTLMKQCPDVKIYQMVQ